MAERDLMTVPGAGTAAQPDAIGACLDRLRRSLQWRSDVDEIVAEMEDHLREAAARLVDRGVDTDDAAAAAVGRLGEPDSVARSFASTPSGGLALPTRLTRAVGLVAQVAAAMWLLAVALSPLATDLVVPWQRSYYAVWSGSVVIAAVATTVALWGLLIRGAVGAWRGALAIGVLLLATAALVAGSWLWMLGTGLLALGALLVLSQVRAQGLRLSRVDWLVLGTPVGAVVTLGLERLVSGAVNESIPSLLGFGIAATANAVALFRLGSWLRSETPADLDDRELVA